MPEAKSPVTAIVVAGGKQYRVAAGDQVLVGRLKAEVGAELVLDRVLLHVDGQEVKVGNPGIEGLTVTAKVLRHSRGPRIEVLRYKSKKNVRVHKGARADYTAIEVLAIGDRKPAKKSETKGETKAETKAEAKPKAARTRNKAEEKPDGS